MRALLITILIVATAQAQPKKDSPKKLDIFFEGAKVGDVGQLPAAVEPPGDKPSVDLVLFKVETIKDDLVLICAEHFQSAIGKRFFVVKQTTKPMKEGQIFVPKGMWVISDTLKFGDKERYVLEPQKDAIDTMPLNEKKGWYMLLTGQRDRIDKTAGPKEKAKDPKRWQAYRDELWAVIYREYKFTESEVKKVLDEGDREKWEKKPGDAERIAKELEAARDALVKRKSQYIVLVAARAKIEATLPKPKDATVKDVAKWQSAVDAEWSKAYAEVKLKASEATAILAQGDKEKWPTK